MRHSYLNFVEACYSERPLADELVRATERGQPNLRNCFFNPFQTEPLTEKGFGGPAPEVVWMSLQRFRLKLRRQGF
jgi:hypothetical protein